PITRAFNWFIGGLNGLPQVSKLKPLGVELQGTNSQSCALAAVSGIEQHLGLPVPKWTPKTAVVHQVHWLDDVMDHVTRSLQYVHATVFLNTVAGHLPPIQLDASRQGMAQQLH
ncbi:hypothetical protein FRC04_003760, partial [Tulasnella sp. 424]